MTNTQAELYGANNKVPSASDSPIWWRNPFCWLVLIGPITVVIAGFITLWLAASGADTLVERDYYKKGLALSRDADVSEGALQPARVARNHAATGGAPTTTPAPGK